MSTNGSAIVNHASQQAADSPTEELKAKPVARVRMVQAVIAQGDKVCAVRRRNFWELPGTLTRASGDGEEEDVEACLARGIEECLAVKVVESFKLYEGPNTSVFAVGVATPSVPRKTALMKAWLTPDELVLNSERPELMKTVFAAAARATVTLSNVISKLKDGRVLYAIMYDTFDGKKWTPHDPHYVHALSAEDAREQFVQTIPQELGGIQKINIVGVAPAIGFEEKEEGVLLG